MKNLRLRKTRLEAFGAVLRDFGEVHGPVAENGVHVFRRLEDWSAVCLDYMRTVLPPKKYFLPPRETLFRYTPETGYVADDDDLERKLVLFGLHPCDISALNILDLVFGGEYPDPYFQTRRKNIAVIGIDCVPDEHCFCRSMRSDIVDRGFDLFLYDVGEHYLTFVGTARGDDMVLAAASLFEEISRADIDEYKRRSSLKRSAFRIDLEIRDLPEIFDMEYESSIWEELGRRCLACGSCSMVCPTCYCYDVVDRVDLGTNTSTRVRCWDSCLFSSHARVAGGENFRDRQADRIKFRFYHKQRGFVAEYGRPSCVGCGRCAASCPIGIDIVEVLRGLRGVDHVRDS
jgi:sulfhydrogenase subunit beta (sulfur reductase)